MCESTLVLGYDAREAWLTAASHWGTERRRTHLLRHSVAMPLSVDSDVWRSVFDTVPGCFRPDWTGPVQDLWDNDSALAATLRSTPPLASQKICWVAVELVSSSASEFLLAQWRERVASVSPPSLDQFAARHAGYDVADYYLTSALSNCGAALWSDRREWAALLNDHHLFTELGAALRFRAEADRHVQEHAPFFVFGLWLLDPPPAAP